MITTAYTRDGRQAGFGMAACAHTGRVWILPTFVAVTGDVSVPPTPHAWSPST